MRCLVLLHEPAEVPNSRIGARFMVDRPGFRVGSDKSCELVSRDPEVRPVHARILADAAGHSQLEDWTDTDAGTFVNDVRVASPVRLSPGDEIRIGTTLLRFLDTRSKRSIESDYHEAIYWLIGHDPVTRVARQRTLIERVDELKKKGCGYLLVQFDLEARASFRTLRKLSAALSNATRHLVVRTGPSRVAVLLPGATVDAARAEARALEESLAADGLPLTARLTAEIV